MPKCVLSRAAFQDLEEIWDYIAFENEKSAHKVMNRIEKTFESLLRMPGMGHKRSDLTHHSVLFFPVEHYLIVYKKHLNDIHIVRVLSGYRDIAEILE